MAEANNEQGRPSELLVNFSLSKTGRAGYYKGRAFLISVNYAKLAVFKIPKLPNWQISELLADK